jgi:Platelet-activating factor acetylhydrolase, isoform II
MNLFMLIFIIVVILGLIILPYWLIPAHPFPQPSGQWQVGKSDLIWDAPSQSGIIAKVWYPTDLDLVTDSPYLGKIGKTFSKNLVVNLLFKLIFSPLLLGHIQIPASIDAALSQSQSNFPVILFSSGLSINFLNSFYALEFASHGFIVVGIDHPGISVSTMLVNGAQIGMDKEISDGLARPDLLVSQIAVTQANQISMVLDRVISMNSTNNSFLDRKVNIEQIFAAGHSIGGSASFVACGQDRRISKSVNFDGYFYIDEIDISYPEKEFLLILSHREKYTIDGGKSQSIYNSMMAKDRTRIQQLAGNVNLQVLTLESASHFSFLDLPLMINPILSKKIESFGGIDPHSLLSKTSAISIDFFKKL